MKRIVLIFLLLLVPIVIANSPPVLEDTGIHDLFVGQKFSYLLKFSDPDSNDVILLDNSDLFDITPLGLVSFTPKSDDVGIHKAKITANDHEIEVSEDMTLVINSNATLFTVEPLSINAKSKINESLKRIISVTNDGNQIAYGIIENTLNGDSEFEVMPKETFSTEAIITLDSPIKTGNIVIHGSPEPNSIPIILSATSGSAIGVAIGISAQFSDIEPGKEIAASLRLVNNGKEEKDIIVEYLVKDMGNNVIPITISKDEIKLKVSDEPLVMTKKVKLPEFLGDGKYVLAAIVHSGGQIEADGKTFSVASTQESSTQGFQFNTQLVVSLIIVILVIVLLYLNYGHITKVEKPEHVERVYSKLIRKKEEDENVEESISNTKKQLKGLQKAYKSKLVSEASYKAGKKRLEKEIRLLNRKLK